MGGTNEVHNLVVFNQLGLFRRLLAGQRPKFIFIQSGAEEYKVVYQARFKSL